MGNGAKRDLSNMSFSRKDSADGKAGGPIAGKLDSKQQNGGLALSGIHRVGLADIPPGTRSGFRTDSAISNSRAGSERVLQPWVSDMPEGADGSLENSGSSGHWDQFAENERLFGIKTDYDENIYTTAIDKNHPQYRERMAAADRKAREIEQSLPTTAHVAEERVMDFAGGDNRGGDEEDRYVCFLYETECYEQWP